MIVGDLVKKTKGYNSKTGLHGIIIGFEDFIPPNNKNITLKKLIVYTDGSIEKWVAKFVEKL
tara:strand:+ start:1003 stop:1188 length:186 start_codon:yes stop_codon:yes gene_type:complete